MEYVFMLENMYSAVRLNGFYQRVPKGWSYPNHRHTIFEFIYCVSGSVEQWINGEPFQLQSGDAVIVKYGVYHHTAPMTEDTDLFVFHFDVEIEELHAVFQLLANPVIRASDENEHKGAVDKWVRGFIEEFGSYLQHRCGPDEREDHLLRMKSALMRLRMQTRFLEMIRHLAEYILSQPETLSLSSMQPAQLKLAHDAAYWLDTHYREESKIGQLAQELNVHRSYLTQCFKQVYGLSPRAYLTRIRLREAKRMLQETDSTIEEIAGQLCFSSAAHFSRFFQAAMAVSPHQFRSHLKRR